MKIANSIDDDNGEKKPASLSAGSSGLTSLASTADITASPEFEPAIEACYSIALGNDGGEPSAKSVELFNAKSRINPAKSRSPRNRNQNLVLPPPPKAVTRPREQVSYTIGLPIDDIDENSPRYMMTPRSRSKYELSKAFSLAHPGEDSQDVIDDIFGESNHQDRWDLTIIGFFTALLFNIFAFFGCFLIQSTGRKRTFYSWGVIAGAFVQCVAIAVYIIESRPTA